jgi:hypothetical protein
LEHLEQHRRGVTRCSMTSRALAAGLSRQVGAETNWNAASAGGQYAVALRG